MGAVMFVQCILAGLVADFQYGLKFTVQGTKKGKKKPIMTDFSLVCVSDTGIRAKFHNPTNNKNR